MHFVKDKMQHCIIFTDLTVKKDLFYIDARARYAILKELIRESGCVSIAGRSVEPLSQNEREDDTFLVLFRNSSR
tara:strand:+ start:531 stop:755 length:225 start_codon:yes stop_codon:yes gene_type:complete